MQEIQSAEHVSRAHRCQTERTPPCSREPTRLHANSEDDRYNAHELLISSPTPPFLYPDQPTLFRSPESEAAKRLSQHLAGCQIDAAQQDAPQHQPAGSPVSAGGSHTGLDNKITISLPHSARNHAQRPSKHWNALARLRQLIPHGAQTCTETAASNQQPGSCNDTNHHPPGPHSREHGIIFQEDMPAELASAPMSSDSSTSGPPEPDIAMWPAVSPLENSPSPNSSSSGSLWSDSGESSESARRVGTSEHHTRTSRARSVGLYAESTSPAARTSHRRSRRSARSARLSARGSRASRASRSAEHSQISGRRRSTRRSTSGRLSSADALLDDQPGAPQSRASQFGTFMGAPQKDPVQRLLAGEIDADHFASSLGTVSRERAAKLQAALVAHVARRGHLHRTLLTHLDAMAAVLAPSGMLLGQHVYKGYELCAEADWPLAYHVAMSQGCELARTHPCGDADEALALCDNAVAAAVARAAHEKAERQALEDRRRLAQALLEASKSTLVATFGCARDLQRRLNAGTAQAAAVEALALFPYHEPGQWYLSPDQPRTRCSIQEECLVATVVTVDAPVAVSGAGDPRLTYLDQHRLAKLGVAKVFSAYAAPVHHRPDDGGSTEIVGVLLAVNKQATLGALADAAPSRQGFTATDRALVDAVAGVLGSTLKLVVRQTVLRTAQEEHVSSIVAISSIFAGLRIVNSAFPGGAMWGAVEAHAMRLVSCTAVKFFAAATGPSGGGGDGDGGSGAAYRHSADSNWQRASATEEEHDVFEGAWTTGFPRCRGVEHRALLVLPLLDEYPDHDRLQQPVHDPNGGPGPGPAAVQLARAAPPDQARRAPWAVFVCAGTDREGVGFGSHDMAMLREWARLCAAPLRSAGLLSGG